MRAAASWVFIEAYSLTILSVFLIAFVLFWPASLPGEPGSASRAFYPTPGPRGSLPRACLLGGGGCGGCDVCGAMFVGRG